MQMQKQGYDNLVEDGAETDVEASEEDETIQGPEQAGPLPLLLRACMFYLAVVACCLFIGFWLFVIGAHIFAPPEPRSAPGNEIWTPVLPANFSGCSTSGFWRGQGVYPPGIDCTSLEERGELLGEWREGWGVFSSYFYYVQTTTAGEETFIHAQSAFGWHFGQEWRLWRGDTTDGPVLTILQDWWGQPWFAYDKVRIFDVFQDRLHVARITETLPTDWFDYGGATVDIRPPMVAGENVGDVPGDLVRMTQVGDGLPVGSEYFTFPAWQVQNNAAQSIPSAVPSFYSMLSDITSQEEAIAPIWWILFFVTAIAPLFGFAEWDKSTKIFFFFWVVLLFLVFPRLRSG